MGATATRRSAEGSVPQRVAVAVSGGRDSTALWHATARRAAAQGLEVHGLHVHHGLSPQADVWVKHLQRQASGWRRRGWPVWLHWTGLASRPAPGDSIEAWARRERYAALTRMATEQGCTLVLLAHHRRDQAETFLLQALRGGGPAGLAAMPQAADRHGIGWARPWLDQPRTAVESYLRRHRLRWVDDPSNADPRLARDALRLQVWPALETAFADAEPTLAAAARRSAEAASCLRELASIDLQSSGSGADGLLAEPLWQLSPGRRVNALRHGLAALVAAPLPQTLLDRVLQELPGCSSARWPAPGGWLTWYDGRLRFAPGGPFKEPTPPVDAATPGARRLDLRRPGPHDLGPGLGTLNVARTRQAGVAVETLAEVEVRSRVGGERFQRAPASLPRSLKKQYQALRVPAWLRVDPLLFVGGELLFVPGLGVDARRLAEPGRPQMSLRWEPAGLR